MVFAAEACHLQLLTKIVLVTILFYFILSYFTLSAITIQGPAPKSGTASTLLRWLGKKDRLPPRCNVPAVPGTRRTILWLHRGTPFACSAFAVAWVLCRRSHRSGTGSRAVCWTKIQFPHAPLSMHSDERKGHACAKHLTSMNIAFLFSRVGYSKQCFFLLSRLLSDAMWDKTLCPAIPLRNVKSGSQQPSSRNPW